MKKLIIICVLICLLFAAYESRIELPPADNTTLAEELITHTYSDADLASIGENYDNILDLARDYKIECIRDPREFLKIIFPILCSCRTPVSGHLCTSMPPSLATIKAV